MLCKDMNGGSAEVAALEVRWNGGLVLKVRMMRQSCGEMLQDRDPYVNEMMVKLHVRL